MRQKLKNWFVGLSRTAKFLLIAAGVVVIGTAANGGDGTQSQQVVKTENTAAVKQQDDKKEQQKQPAITTKEEVVNEPIAYQKQTQETSSMNKGQTRISQPGEQGILAKTYKVTLGDGIEIKRELVSEAIAKQAVAEITQVGTYVAPAPKPAATCDSNYSGCVPIASDVDCSSGSGDGPAYVSGPIRVIGYDKYGLDRDGDGIACDS